MQPQLWSAMRQTGRHAAVILWAIVLAARFNLLVNRCKFVQRRRDGTPRWDEVAHFLGVTTNTVRRWRTGELAIPRSVEIVVETYHALPTAEAQNALAAIRLQDEAATQRNVR